MNPSTHPALREQNKATSLLLGAAIFLLGMNLRPALSGIAPLLESIRASTGISATAAGLLNTLPVLCFGLIAPLGAQLARRLTLERAVVLGMAMLTASLVLRVFFGGAGLFIGTFLAGSSIGIVMVLLPAVIKRDFPASVGLWTGLYTSALALGAALAAGLAVPLQQLAGGEWRWSLMFWALPACLGTGVWFAASRRHRTLPDDARIPVRGLYRSALAWQVAGFLGCTSLLAYCVFGWLPTILIERGFPPLMAGTVLSLSIAAQLPATLAGPWIASKGQDQRLIAAVLVALPIAALFGCMYGAPDHIWLWALLLGLGQGGAFSVATMLVVLRSPNAQVVAALSGMTQMVGYMLAACGPVIAGALRDWSGDWDLAAGFFGVIAAAGLCAGLGAGRKLQIQAGAERVR